MTALVNIEYKLVITFLDINYELMIPLTITPAFKAL